MHSHLEIVMPAVADVEAAVRQVMGPFDENGEDANHAFWDFWVIGGRWSGAKLEARLDVARIDKFYEVLKAKHVTVSGVRAGKPTLSPPSQIADVDALWREHFPEGGNVCPLFDHYNDRYTNSPHGHDVMLLKDVPQKLACNHLIIAGPRYDGDGIEAKYMIEKSMWNGVSYIDTKWDGALQSAIATHTESLASAKPDYAEKHIPRDDWLVVTVDYHS